MVGEELKNFIQNKQLSLQEQKKLEALKDYEMVQNAIRQKELADQTEQMKKKAMRDIVS